MFSTMFRRTKLNKVILTSLSAALLLSACSSDEEAASVADSTPVMASAIDEASAAMGMDGINSITYSGSAWSVRNSFRQTPSASAPWLLRDTVTNYVRTIDLTEAASLATGDTFWQNLFFDPAVEGNYIQDVASDETNWGQQLEYWLTPWGFLQGAEDNDGQESAQMMDGESYKVVTWMTPTNQTSPSGLQYTVTGYINSDNLVTKVETWVEDAFMGDMHVAALYSDYTELDGVMVPTTMEQQRGEGGVFGVSISAADVNPADLTALMEAPEPFGGTFFGGGGEPPAELTEELAEGVYLISGGYVAMVVEFEDHLLVFEAGQSEARGEQILEEVRGISDKPIRYIVNSHPHSDHTAGLIPFVREGATVITEASNVEFLDMALSTPRSLLGEATLTPEFIGVDGVGVQEDSSMRLELHHIPNGHTDGMLVAYLPEQGILFQADFTLPVEGAEANPFVVQLAEYIDENALDFETYLAVHAAAEPQTKADLMATIGK